MIIKSLLPLAIAAAFSAGPAFAAPLYEETTPTGALESPGATSYSFTSIATQATLSFELAGYATLDGNNPGYTDVFTLAVNGVDVFSGMFHMGGGGISEVTLAPAGTTWSVYTTGCSTPNNCSASEIPGQGGHTNVSLPIALAAGTNTLTFSYAGGAQGLSDEGWGVNSLSVTAVPEPETYAMLAAGLGLLGLARRRVRTAG